MKQQWGTSLIALLLGVSVLTLGVLDYVTSPANNKGIHIGQLFIPIGPHAAPVARHSQQPAVGPHHHSSSGTHHPSSSGTASAIGPNGLKRSIVGILDKTGLPTNPAYDGVLAGYVVPVRWADLEPVAGGPIVANNAIDRAIAQVRSFNAANPSHPWVLKLRVTAGYDAPNWAKNLGGPPVTVISIRPPLTGTVGRFWLAPYEAAYAALQVKLAAKYDAVPEVREVVDTMCQTVYSEPMIRQVQVIQTDTNLLAAGYTVAADHACQQAAVRSHAIWRITMTDYTFNPYQVVTLTGGNTDIAFTEQIQSYCRQILGARCGLENNSLRVPIQPGGYGTMYSNMKLLGRSITFQLADTDKVGSVPGAITLAIGYGAYSVELMNRYQQIISPSALASSAAALIAAAAGH